MKAINIICHRTNCTVRFMIVYVLEVEYNAVIIIPGVFKLFVCGSEMYGDIHIEN